MNLFLDDSALPNQELNVSISNKIGSADVSGETSGTGNSHQGIKAKIVSINFIIPDDKPKLLTDFYRIAESTDDQGNLVVYSITNDLVNAAGIRQVIFSDSIDAREMRTLNAWAITCKLKEQFSVPERTEERQNSDTVPPVPEVTPDNATNFDYAQVIIDRALNQ